MCGFGQVPTFARTCASSSIVLTVVAPLSAITAESGLPTIHTHTHTYTHTHAYTHMFVCGAHWGQEYWCGCGYFLRALGVWHLTPHFTPHLTPHLNLDVLIPRCFDTSIPLCSLVLHFCGWGQTTVQGMWCGRCWGSWGGS